MTTTENMMKNLKEKIKSKKFKEYNCDECNTKIIVEKKYQYPYCPVCKNAWKIIK